MTEPAPPTADNPPKFANEIFMDLAIALNTARHELRELMVTTDEFMTQLDKAIEKYGPIDEGEQESNE